MGVFIFSATANEKSHPLFPMSVSIVVSTWLSATEFIVFLCLRREKMVVFEEGEDGCEWMGGTMNLLKIKSESGLLYNVLNVIN